jgi:SAM-dependent methyltransferase
MTGIDVSTEMLNRLRGKLHSRTASAKIINGDILEFKFEEASFDVVLCLFGVLAHVHRKLRRSELLGKFHQLLNRGGYLFVSVPNVYRRFLYRQIQSYVLGRLRWRQYEGLETNDVLYYRRVMGERVRSYYHLYSAKGFKKELTDCGFAHVEVTSESILPEEFVLRRPRIASLCQLFQTTRWLNNLAYDLLAIATN